jgi:twitching motility protein PilT
VAAHEVLVATPAVRNLIREGRSAQLLSAMQAGAAQGMQTLQGSLAGLVQQGRISVATARTGHDRLMAAARAQASPPAAV